MRVIELDGQRFEVRTGRTVEMPEAVPQNPVQTVYNRLDYPSKRYTYESYEQYMEPRLALKITDTLKPDTGGFELLINDIGTIHRVLFSPDERYVAVLYSDTRLRLQLWDLESRRQLFEKAEYRDSTYLEIRFSIDSRTLVAVETVASDYPPYGSENYEHITLWDTASGERTFTDYGYWSIPIYSPNDEWFAYPVGTYGVAGELLIWNGVELLHTGVAYPSEVRFDGEGDTLIVSVGGVGIAVIHLDIGDRAIKEVITIPLESQYYAFTEDNQLVLGQGFTTPPTLWNIETMTEVGVLDTEQSLNDVLFSPDSEFIMIDHKTFWDTETAEKIFETDMPVSLAPDWSWAVYWEGGELVVRNLSDGSETRKALFEPSYGTVVSVDPLKRWVLFQNESELAAYQVSTGEQAFTISTDVPVNHVNITSDGSKLIVELGDGLRNGRWEHVSAYDISSGHDAVQINAVETYWRQDLINTDGTVGANLWKLGGGMGPRLIWFNLESTEELAEWLSSYNSFQGAGFHPANNWLAVSTWDSTYIIDVTQTIERGGEPVALLEQRHDFAPVANPGFSPSGHFLIVECGNNCFTLTDLRDLPETGILIEPDDIYLRDVSGLSFDAAETMILTKSSLTADAHLRLDIEAESIATLPATGDAIALNADGTLAATVITEGIALWDVEAVRAGDLTLLATYPITGLAPTQLTFDSDDRLIALEPSGVTVYESPVTSER